MINTEENNVKTPILILSILVLFATASIAFCMKSNQQDDISFVEEEISSSSEESEESDADDTFNEIEIIAYLNSNIYYFAGVSKRFFTAYCKTYLSPANIFNNPPPEYI